MEARGEGHPTVTLREPELPGAAGDAARLPVSPGFGTATAGSPAHRRSLCTESRTWVSRHSRLTFRQERVHGTANYNSHTASRTQIPRPARFRSAASLPFLPDCGLVIRFVLGRGFSTVPPKPLPIHNPVLSCWEVNADAFASRGADTASHVMPRWRRCRSCPRFVASKESRRFPPSGRRDGNAWLIPAAARSVVLGIRSGPGLLLSRCVQGSPGDLAAVFCVGSARRRRRRRA